MQPTSQIDFPTRISIDNKVHPTYTLIQIETPDRLGLLYDLLSCLDREGVYIALSRISTEKGAAIDTFYVADATTRGKITDSNRISCIAERNCMMPHLCNADAVTTECVGKIGY